MRALSLAKCIGLAISKLRADARAPPSSDISHLHVNDIRLFWPTVGMVFADSLNVAQPLLRAKPSKDGDAELRSYRGIAATLAGPPAHRLGSTP